MYILHGDNGKEAENYYLGFRGMISIMKNQAHER